MKIILATIIAIFTMIGVCATIGGIVSWYRSPQRKLDKATRDWYKLNRNR